MTLEAGLTTRSVARLARENGLWFPPNPGAADQSQLGGNVATNAGGPRSFRYGPVRHWLSGLEAVLPDGELVRMGGPARKNVETLDLLGVFCGSEGTLGVVTAAWLKLLPSPERLLPVVGMYPDRETGLEAMTAAMACGIVPTALEFLDERVLEAARVGFPVERPDSGRFLILAETAGSESVARAEREILVDALEQGAVMVVAPDDDASARAWERWRDGISLAVVAVRGGKLSEDFTEPTDRLGEALELVDALGARHGVEVMCWGHAGDGNVHATVLANRLDPEDLARGEQAAAALFDIPFALDGALSGEHGIGVVKLAAARRLPVAVQRAQSAVKAALDPRGIMNPGRKVPGP
jgi:FAD/FMN-containing dehydrogenase